MSLLRAIAFRLALVATIVALGGLLSAVLVRSAPGFGTDERQLDARLNSASIQAIRDASAQERSVASYYAKSLLHLLRGDLGTSRSLQRPVRELLAERRAVTLRLVCSGLSLAWMASILLVLATWVVRSAALERGCAIAAGAFLCLPAGAVALLLILLNGPAYVALALVLFPKVHRYLSNLVSATGQMPHITTSVAKGVPRVQVLCLHIVPVIKREILALAGVSVGLAVSAAIPVEALSGIAGVGQLAWQAALARDLPLLTSVSLLVIACTVLANSGTDLLSDERSQAS